MRSARRESARKAYRISRFSDNGDPKKPSSSVDFSSEGPGNYETILRRQEFKESSGYGDRPNTEAVSPAGARGPAQITPITERFLKEKGLVGDDFDPTDAAQARSAQRAYMDNLLDRTWNTGSDEVRMAKALAAYNFGPTATVRALNKAKEKGYDIYNSLDWLEEFPTETKDYAYKILGYNEKFDREYQREVNR